MGWQCRGSAPAFLPCNCAARVSFRERGHPLRQFRHFDINKSLYGGYHGPQTANSSLSNEELNKTVFGDALHDSIREVWQAYRASRLSEEQGAEVCQVKAMLRDFLETAFEEFGDQHEGLQQLSWGDVVKLFWLSVHAELGQIQLDRFLCTLIPVVRDKVDAGERLSHRLSLSLLMASLRLDAMEDVISLVSFEYGSLNTDDILRLCSIYAQSSQYENTDALGKELSRRISSNLLEEIRVVEFQDFLDYVSKIKWNPSIREKKEIYRKAEGCRTHLTASNIASLVQLLNRPPHLSAEDMQLVSSLVSYRLHLCSMKELGIIAKTLSRFHQNNPRRWTATMFDDIAAQATTCVDSADPKDVVRLIQAFQNAQIKPEGLLDVLDIWADKRLASMNAQGISLAMAHFARIGEASQRLLHTAVTVAESTMDQMSPSDASRLIWAFARLEYYPGDKLLQEGIQILQSSTTATDFSDRDTANLFWGIVKLGKYPSATEHSKIASNLYRTPGKLSGQSAALLLWSFASSQDATGNATAGQKFYSTIYRLGMEVYRDINQVDSQSISMTAWSLGVLKVPHKEFVYSLDQLVLSNRLSSFEPQHVSNLLWGLAKSGARPSTECLDNILQVLSGNLHAYSPQELFNICWSYATLGATASPIVPEIVLELEIRGTEFEGLELSGLTWSLSRLFRLQRMQDGSYDLDDLPKRIVHVVEKELPKHMASLEASQVAMAVVGLGRLSEMDKTININPSLIDFSLDTFHKNIIDDNFSISSLNTVLEGLQILGRQLPPSLHDALRSNITVSTLSRTRIWEICDLCYNACECNVMDVSLEILAFIDEQIADNQRITPRASIMLLHTMCQLDTYPTTTVFQTTSKLASLSPNYNLTEKWLSVLAQTREKLPMHIKHMLELHPEWEEKLQNL